MLIGKWLPLYLNPLQANSLNTPPSYPIQSRQRTLTQSRLFIPFFLNTLSRKRSAGMTLAGSRAECIACNSMQGHGHHGRPVAEDPGHHFDQVTQTHSKRARSDDHTCNATLYDWQSHNPVSEDASAYLIFMLMAPQTLRVPVGQHAFIADTTSITLSRKEYDQLQRDLGRALAKNDEMLLRHNLLERLIATKSAECDKLYNMLHQRMASDSAPPAGGDGLIQVQRETLGSAVWSAAWSLLNANGCGQLRQLIRTLGIVLDREVIDSLVDMEASMSATAGSATSARELIEKLLAFPLGRSKFGLYSHLPHSTEDDTQLTQAAFETVIAILARPSLFPQAPDSSTGSASLVICGQPLYTLPSLEQCQAVIDHSDWWRAHDTLQEAMSECVYNAVEPAFSSAAFPHVAGYIRIDGAAAPWLISFADKRVTLFGVVRGTSQHVKHVSFVG